MTNSTKVKITGAFSELKDRQGNLTGNNTGILFEVDFGGGLKGMFTKHEFNFVESETKEDENKVATGNEGLEFKDLKLKKSFRSLVYRIEKKNGKTFAITKSIFGEYEIHKALTKKELSKIIGE